MSELDKLEAYLKKHKIKYKRIDEVPEFQIEQAKLHNFYEDGMFERHQIMVLNDQGKREWDVICHWGSYGFKQGLLELYGNLVTKADGDDVVGWLTAQDVIDRLTDRTVENEKEKGGRR